MNDFGNEPIRLRGEVIYNKAISGRRYSIPPGMAVQFSGVSAEEAAAVRSIVTDLLVGDIIHEQIEPVLTMQ